MRPKALSKSVSSLMRLEGIDNPIWNELNSCKVRRCAAAEIFFDQMEDVGIVFQVGIGDWGEGPAVLKCFPKAELYSVEPLVYWQNKSRKRGLKGRIGTYIVWDKDDVLFELEDEGSRSSVFHPKPHCKLNVVTVPSITLDSLQKMWDIPYKRTLLWMDCEGAELHALRGASKFLNQVEYVVCEMRRRVWFPGWASGKEIKSYLRSCGFDYIDHIYGDGLFVKNKSKYSESCIKVEEILSAP